MFEHDEKINTYQTAIDDITNQLREKRTELATLAQKTVADFEAAIPALQSKSEELRADIQKLDVEILRKQTQYNSERTSFLSEFEAMKKRLQAEYDEIIKELKQLKLETRKSAEDYQAKTKDLEAKTKELDASLEIVNAQQVSNQKAMLSFEIEKENHLKELSKSKAVVAENEKVNCELGATLKNKIAETNKQNTILTESLVQANATIARIKEANDAFAKASSKEAEIRKRTEKNNTDFVEIRAKQKRQSLRDDEQNKREESLKIRENNIKTVEQRIAEQGAAL